jgi:hypothetical protein
MRKEFTTILMLILILILGIFYGVNQMASERPVSLYENTRGPTAQQTKYIPEGLKYSQSSGLPTGNQGR